MDKQLVYYPGFEPTDHNWLKFALLYLEQVTPIIPDSGDIHLSDDFLNIRDSTTLLRPLRPGYEEGCNATADAIDQVDRVLRSPLTFEHVFNKSNVVAEWKSKRRQVIELYSEKYGDEWERYCIANKLGRRTDHGILLSRSLADVYMTILAHTISDGRGVSPITDDRKMDRYGLFLRNDATDKNAQSAITLAQGVISLKAPHLEGLSVEKIVRFRNEQNIAALRTGLNTAITNYLTAVTSDCDAEAFAKELNTIFSAFTDEFAKIGGALVPISLGFYTAFVAPSFDEHRILNCVGGAVAITTNTLISCRNAWKNTEVKRMANRYLTRISELK